MFYSFDVVLAWRKLLVDHEVEKTIFILWTIKETDELW